MNESILRLGEQLYRRAYTAYLPLYSTHKSISDRTERQLLRSVVRPGMTVVDVGANIGVHTRYLARLCGPNGRVVAFEPSPINFARLKANVRNCRTLRSTRRRSVASRGPYRSICRRT